MGGRKTWGRECLGVVHSNRMGQSRRETGAIGLQREQTRVEGWGWGRAEKAQERSSLAWTLGAQEK